MQRYPPTGIVPHATTTCLFINSERRAENLDPIEHYEHKWSPQCVGSTKPLGHKQVIQERVTDVVQSIKIKTAFSMKISVLLLSEKGCVVIFLLINYLLPSLTTICCLHSTNTHHIHTAPH